MAAEYKSAFGLASSMIDPCENSLPKCVCCFPTLKLITAEDHAGNAEDTRSGTRKPIAQENPHRSFVNGIL